MYKKIKEMEPGKTLKTVLLVTAIQEKTAKNNSKFVVFTLSDGETTVEAKLWNSDKNSVKILEKELGSFSIRGDLYNDQMSYVIENYSKPPEDAKISDFVIKAPMDGKEMFDRILFMVRKKSPEDSTIVKLVEKVYEDNKESLLYWSAAKKMHHNRYAGLLQHTYHMVCIAYVVLGAYKQLDPELLLAITALHDIGKLKELETDNMGVADYSLTGRLFGHAHLGIQIVEATANEMKANGTSFDEEKLMLLLHGIGAHAGKEEYGAEAAPATQEAFVVHMIDDMDAKLDMFAETLRDMEPGTLSDRVWRLGNNSVYKPLYASTRTQETSENNEEKADNAKEVKEENNEAAK